MRVKTNFKIGTKDASKLEELYWKASKNFDMTKAFKVEPNERVIKKKEVWDVSLDFTYHVNGRGEEDRG